MRIIAGSLRGRKLEAPLGITTRPTSDRVKEAWFNMLGPLEGRALDLYAGSGALGFEALSRGCEHVVFVERDRKACRMIAHNAKRLGVENQITVLETSVERAKKRIEQEGPFDLIVSDPPWTLAEEVELALKRTLAANLLKAHGQLVIGSERDQKIALAAASELVEIKSRSWGRAQATFFARSADQAAGDGDDWQI